MHIPLATYRLQLHKGFTFLQARSMVRYLSLLGISDVYCSPLTRARPGSMHGYDVLDPNQVNPELGGREGLDAFVAETRAHGLGILQDIVPNHMAFDGDNAMLVDLFEQGQDSRFFRFFDVEWNHPYENMKGRILAPVLGSRFGETLEQGTLVLVYGPTGFHIKYADHHFPVRIQSYGNILSLHLAALRRKLPSGSPDYIKLLGLLYTLKNLPAGKENTDDLYEQTTFVKRLLWELYQSNGDVRAHIDNNVGILNGNRGSKDGLALLNTLLSEQLFRLAYWKVATEELNYRRFFTINDLICLRQEDEEVQTRTHALILDLVAQGVLAGLRIDHIDGLYDPFAYLQRLRLAAKDAYIVVEKILALSESVPAQWPIQGTTGYDFLNAINAVLCDSRSARVMTETYERFTGLHTPYEELVLQKKRLIIDQHMVGDIDNLAHLIKRITSNDRRGSDFTLHGLRRALAEIMVFFPVYRTYIRQGGRREQDMGYVQQALDQALAHNPDLGQELRFVGDFLLLHFRDDRPEDDRKEWLHFVMRFQQFTGPLTAKGFEDTLLYTYHRLTSLNEVGSTPGTFGMSVREFHAFVQRRAEAWPHTMNATATHDTKRGEDTRARIAVLSEIPQEWRQAAQRWERINRTKKRTVSGLKAPDRNDEYLLYQTLLGTLPFNREIDPEYTRRMCDYMIKAVREAKIHSTWLDTDEQYEQALMGFIGDLLHDSAPGGFLEDFAQVHAQVAHGGVFNSLSQILVKMTAPGVPDFYQGTELWDFHLVDPDNRGTVDYTLRASLLDNLRTAEAEAHASLLQDLLAHKEDGRIKLYTIHKALRTRCEHEELFAAGSYEPLRPAGGQKDNVIAFARRLNGRFAVTVVPRLSIKLQQELAPPIGKRAWKETLLRLPAGVQRWTEVFTQTSIEGESGQVADILKCFPVALLLGEQSRETPEGTTEQQQPEGPVTP